jgi:hypothetical protein
MARVDGIRATNIRRWEQLEADNRRMFEELQQRSWTAVTDRLPAPTTHPTEHLVTDGKRIWVEMQHPSWWNHKDQGVVVTHWMPLPPFPAGSKPRPPSYWDDPEDDIQW